MKLINRKITPRQYFKPELATGIDDNPIFDVCLSNDEGLNINPIE